MEKGIMDEEQRRFWDELLAYYRQELKERQHPAMVSMLGFFHGQKQALEDKRLAEEGRVYLLKGGRRLTKPIDELNPSDAPYLMAELEANETMVEEHSVAEGDITMTQVPGGGATFTHPHYEDATRHLRERWRELKGRWQAR